MVGDSTLNIHLYSVTNLTPRKRKLKKTYLLKPSSHIPDHRNSLLFKTTGILKHNSIARNSTTLPHLSRPWPFTPSSSGMGFKPSTPLFLLPYLFQHSQYRKLGLGWSERSRDHKDFSDSHHYTPNVFYPSEEQNMYTVRKVGFLSFFLLNSHICIVYYSKRLLPNSSS